MNRAWALQLDFADARTLGRLRGAAGLQVCLVGQVLWLRGNELPPDLEPQLRSLPAAGRYRVGEQRTLVRHDGRVPRGLLPTGPWTELSQWLQVEFGAAGLSGRKPPVEHLRLLRCDRPRETNVLLTRLASWLAYGSLAPAVRLARWSFAADDRGQVVVRGQPLPPLPGRQLVERQGVAIPAGYAWSPPVEPEVLKEVLGLPPGDLALFDADGSWERIEADWFVRATRSAIRQTAGETA